MKQDNGIVDIHGKQYKTVALRVTEFREKYAETYSLITDVVHRDSVCVVVRASILDNTGRTIATGHAEEYRDSSKINKVSALENAETSAIGRCLASFGYAGTEFASADEVARAIGGKPVARNPDPIDGAIKWGKDNAALIDRAGLREDWDNAADACDLPSLRAIVKACKARKSVRIKDTDQLYKRLPHWAIPTVPAQPKKPVDMSPITDSDIPA
jgi:hypothetical protein